MVRSRRGARVAPGAGVSGASASLCHVPAAARMRLPCVVRGGWWGLLGDAVIMLQLARAAAVEPTASLADVA